MTRGGGVKKFIIFMDVIDGSPLREKIFGKSYPLENNTQESIFREDLFLYNCPQPIAFAVFCAAFAAAVTASGDGDEVGAVPGHTVAEMEEKVVSIKGDAR